MPALSILDRYPHGMPTNKEELVEWIDAKLVIIKRDYDALATEYFSSLGMSASSRSRGPRHFRAQILAHLRAIEVYVVVKVDVLGSRYDQVHPGLVKELEEFDLREATRALLEEMIEREDADDWREIGSRLRPRADHRETLERERQKTDALQFMDAVAAGHLKPSVDDAADQWNDGVITYHSSPRLPPPPGFYPRASKV